MSITKGKQNRRSWRILVGTSLTILGLLILHFVAEVPPLSNKLDTLVTHPTFLNHTIALPFDAEEHNSYSLLTRWVTGHFSWMNWSEETLEEGERSYSLLPPMPQPVNPSTSSSTTESEPQQEEPVGDSGGGDWVQKTMTAGGNHVQVGEIYVANSGKVSVENATVPAMSPVIMDGGNAPEILIYHSHGTESYTPTAGFEYVESDPFRTTDEGRNILVVGAAMAEVFRQAGYSVIHDTNFHDYPDYNSSYSNSSKTLSTYLQQYPSIKLIFDVHRDALADSNGTPYQLVSQQNGTDVAQVMLVVGSNGDGYEHPNWRENFALALSIQEGLLEYGDLARPLTLRSSRFNQHLSTGALLLEIGGHGNTLEQAIDGGVLFAESVVKTLGNLE